MNKRQLKNAEWSILITTILLIVVGLVAQYSATLSADLADFKKQIIWLVVSIPIFLITIIIDYRTIAKASIVFYIVCLILLLTVLFTSAVNGARSWFSIGPISIQPGEFAKIAVVLLLATTINKINKREHGKINSPLKLIETIGICLLPVILIALQPDYGTAMSYIVSLLFMLFVAGINKKYIFISILLIIVLVPVMYFFILPEHAKSRIDVYLNPYLDPRGAGYNIIQSKIAIGAGGLIGLGWLKGTQTHLGFLYPKTTDFIFSVIGEEMGFIVAAVVIVLYVILITKSINVAKTAKDDLGSYIAIGIVRNIFISYFGKYRNDNGAITNNRHSITIYKLWRKLVTNKCNLYRVNNKYKHEKTKINIYRVRGKMYIKPLKIGNVELENNVILAPMAGVTDLPFRVICKKYGNPRISVHRNGK